MFHSFRKYTVTLSLIGILWFLFGCDLNTTQKVIFKSPDGRIVVHEANSKPENIEEDGFTFLVDLDLPTYNLEAGDGYHVYIVPFYYSSPNNYGGSQIFPWCKASPLFPAKIRNISRGGRLGYEDTEDNFIHVSQGTVESWRILVERWDASESEDFDYFDDVFDYEVTKL